jgi:hypothetical protein
MATKIFNKEIRDTQTNSTVHGRTSGAETKLLFHVINDLDAEVTVTFYGTRDEDENNNDVKELGSIVVSSDTTDYETLTDPWEKIYIEIVASSTPSNGECTIYAMK